MIKNFLNEFKEFAVKGNVIDMAVGIIIGGAFSPIVNSLVKDIIMPPIGYIMGNVDFSNLYFAITPHSQHYSSLKEAQDAGLVTINYGLFINTLIKFINKLKSEKKEETEEKVEETTKECPYCFSVIDKRAKKCPHCASELQ